MGTLNKIDDKAKFENAYHAIMRCAETFFRIAPNIPKNLCEVVQHIHGRYDRALYYIFDACNTYDKERKINDLSESHSCLFFQQSALEYLVRSHGITIGQANLIIDDTREAYSQISKWKTAVVKVAR